MIVLNANFRLCELHLHKWFTRRAWGDTDDTHLNLYSELQSLTWNYLWMAALRWPWLAPQTPEFSFSLSPFTPVLPPPVSVSVTSTTATSDPSCKPASNPWHHLFPPPSSPSTSNRCTCWYYPLNMSHVFALLSILITTALVCSTISPHLGVQ